MKNSRFNKFLIFLIVIIVVALVGFSLYKYFKNPAGARPSGWQVVYLSNGQVYFGHLQGMGGQMVTINDVYYLPTQKQADLIPGREIADQSVQITLTKLGSQYPGTTNQLQVNRSTIIMVEQLRADSKIVDAINKMK